MSEKPAKKKGNSAPPQGNVIQFPVQCVAEGCKSKIKRANFCTEHYQWFKFGLIKKDGTQPSDFDKKYEAFKRRQAA